MQAVFEQKNYSLERQVFALTGKVRIFDMQGGLALFAEQALFAFKEDIRLYSDESKSREVLAIQARQILDFSAAYDVVESASGRKIGAFRRKGWTSMFRDSWEMLDIYDQVCGVIQEDSQGLALLRRFLLGGLLPQTYHIRQGGRELASLSQKFSFFGYKMDIQILSDDMPPLLVLAAASLLAIVEGKQQN